MLGAAYFLQPSPDLLGKLRYSERPGDYEGDHYTFDSGHWALQKAEDGKLQINPTDWWNVIPAARLEFYKKLEQLERFRGGWTNLESIIGRQLSLLEHLQTPGGHSYEQSVENYYEETEKIYRGVIGKPETWSENLDFNLYSYWIMNAEKHLASVYGYDVSIPKQTWGEVAKKINIKWQVDPDLWDGKHDAISQLVQWVKTVDPASEIVGNAPKALLYGVYYATFPKTDISAEMMFALYDYVTQIDFRYQYAYRGLVHTDTHLTSQYSEALKDPRLDLPDLRPGDLVQPIEDDTSCLEVASVDAEMVNLHYKNVVISIPKSLVRLVDHGVPLRWDGPWPEEIESFPTMLNYGEWRGEVYNVRFFRKTSSETLVYLEEAQGWINAKLMHPLRLEDQMTRVTPKQRVALTTYYANKGNLFWYAAATVTIFVLTELF